MRSFTIHFLLTFLTLFATNSFAYKECLSGNCANGHGSSIERSGSTYTGDFVAALRNGKGTYVSMDGWTYTGDYVNDKRTGKGVYVWPEGDPEGGTYIGRFLNGDAHGRGTRTWPDGDSYVGEWKNGKRHGHGTYTYASNGTKKEGNWENSRFIGVVKINRVVEVDWLTAGDKLISRDPVTGLEWLDVTYTANRSFDDISGEFGWRGEFKGWRYATEEELIEFFDAFGGDSSFYNGEEHHNHGLFNKVARAWGGACDLIEACSTGDGRSTAIYEYPPEKAKEYGLGLVTIENETAKQGDHYGHTKVSFGNVFAYPFEPGAVKKRLTGHALVRNHQPN